MTEIKVALSASRYFEIQLQRAIEEKKKAKV